MFVIGLRLYNKKHLQSYQKPCRLPSIYHQYESHSIPLNKQLLIYTSRFLGTVAPYFPLVVVQYPSQAGVYCLELIFTDHFTILL